MTVRDQDQIVAWCQEHVPYDEGKTLVRSVWADADGVLHATIYRTRDGKPILDPDDPTEAATMDIEIPKAWADTFPVIIGPNAGITAVESEATSPSDPPRDVVP